MSGGRDVFIVCNNIEEMGGLQAWAHAMAGLLAGRGHRVRLIGIVHPETVHPRGNDLPYATEVLYDEHPPTAWRARSLTDLVDVGARVREARRKAGMRKAADRLSSLFRAARPGGIVIVPQVWAMEWVALANTHGLRVIGMSHESHAASCASSRAARVRRLFPRVDRFLLLTREDAEAWIHDGLNNATVMPNPLTFTPSQVSKRREKVAVSLGRLSFEKGYDLLIDAWAAGPAREHPDWTLRIHGSGPEEDALRRRVADLGIGDRVDLAGPTTDVEGALAGASMFVSGSRAEGFPVSMMEAMACALPCVAFDCAPGVRELVRDGGNGVLVPPGNVESLASALSLMAGDQDLRDRLGEQARSDVRAYEADAVLDRWEELFAFVYR